MSNTLKTWVAEEQVNAEDLNSNFALAVVLAGTIRMYAGSSTPDGYLPCDGAAVSRVTYSGLFAVIGTTYGVGDGSTTFNVPDLQGRFAIGKGSGTKVATFSSRSGNIITVTGLSNNAENEFQTGQAVLYSAPSGAMTGLTHNQTYYIVRVTNTTFSLASSRANAVAGTVITLSSNGSGTQTFTLTLSTRTLADTGGEQEHSLLVTEIPSHTHKTPDEASDGPLNDGHESGDAPDGDYNDQYVSQATGGSEDHNNLPPFLAVNFIIKI